MSRPSAFLVLAAAAAAGMARQAAGAAFPIGGRLPDETEVKTVGVFQDVIRNGTLKHGALVNVPASATLTFAPDTPTDFPSLMSTRLETMVQKLATRITGDAQFTAIGARVHVKKAYELAPEGVTKDAVSYHMEARAVVLALACDSDMTASNYLGDDACNSSKPCAVGQGDCDSDVDCLGGLVCGQRTFGDAMPPGVVASSDGHTAGQGDYCYNPVKATPTTVTPCGDAELHGELARHAAAVGFDWVTLASPSLVYASVVYNTCATPVDIVFLLDKSGSVGSNNFKTTLGFVESAVNFFDVGQLPGQSRVGVATFSSSSLHNVEFHLDSQNSKEEALAAIRGIRYTGGYTHTNSALKLVRQKMLLEKEGMRPDSAGIPRVVIVVSDGKANSGYEPWRGNQANLLQGAANVFSIGVGNGPKVSELNMIASDPDEDHSFLVTGFSSMFDIINEIATGSCNSKATLACGESVDVNLAQGDFSYFSVTGAGFHVQLTVESTEGNAEVYIAPQDVSQPGPFAYTDKITGPKATKVHYVFGGADTTKSLSMGVQGTTVAKTAARVTAACFESTTTTTTMTTTTTTTTATSTTTVTTTTVTTNTDVDCFDKATVTQFRFGLATMTTNNLDGADNTTDKAIIYTNVGTDPSGTVLDLVITTDADYKDANGNGYRQAAANDKTLGGGNSTQGSGSHGADLLQINLRRGYTAMLNFAFRDHATGKPVVLEAFYFSFLDLDYPTDGYATQEAAAQAGGFALEEICLDEGTFDAKKSVIPGYGVVPANADATSRVEAGRRCNGAEGGSSVVVYAKTPGNNENNPTDSQNLTAEQARRMAEVAFSNTASFTFSFKVTGGVDGSDGSKPGGRNLFFSGWASAANDVTLCPVPETTAAPPPPPPVAPVTTTQPPGGGDDDDDVGSGDNDDFNGGKFGTNGDGGADVDRKLALQWGFGGGGGLNVPEDAQPGYSVLNISSPRILDEDSGTAGARVNATFTMVQDSGTAAASGLASGGRRRSSRDTGGAAVPFAVDPETGEVTVHGNPDPLDYETQALYEFSVLIQAGGNGTNLEAFNRTVRVVVGIAPVNCTDGYWSATGTFPCLKYTPCAPELSPPSQTADRICAKDDAATDADDGGDGLNIFLALLFMFLLCILCVAALMFRKINKEDNEKEDMEKGVDMSAGTGFDMGKALGAHQPGTEYDAADQAGTAAGHEYMETKADDAGDTYEMAANGAPPADDTYELAAHGSVASASALPTQHAQDQTYELAHGGQDDPVYGIASNTDVGATSYDHDGDGGDGDGGDGTYDVASNLNPAFLAGGRVPRKTDWTSTDGSGDAVYDMGGNSAAGGTSTDTDADGGALYETADNIGVSSRPHSQALSGGGGPRSVSILYDTAGMETNDDEATYELAATKSSLKRSNSYGDALDTVTEADAPAPAATQPYQEAARFTGAGEEASAAVYDIGESNQADYDVALPQADFVEPAPAPLGIPAGRRSPFDTLDTADADAGSDSDAEGDAPALPTKKKDLTMAPGGSGDDGDAPPALPSKARDAGVEADEVDLDLAMELDAMELERDAADDADDGYLDTSNTKGLAFQLDAGDASLRVKSTRKANPLYRESKMDV